MTSKYVFEAVECTLRDVMKTIDPKLPYGRILIVGSDFRQLLPVMPSADRDEIAHSIKLNLTKIMRLMHLDEIYAPHTY